MSLLDKRLIIVAGKGGVGRTTTTLCLALAAARQGRYVAVAELNGASGLPEAWGLPGRAYMPRALTTGIDTFSTTPGETLDDFGQRRLKLDALVRMVFHNRVASAFLDAVPGLHDIIQLGKLYSLLNENWAQDPRYDLIILDAPATGHGLTLLGAARNMAEMTRVGPFYDEARRIDAVLSDPAHTALVLVTLPEALPVNESLQLVDALGPDRDLLAAVVVNQTLLNPLPPGLKWPTMRARLEEAAPPDLAPLLALADRKARRHVAQYRATRRLHDGLPEVLGHPVPVAALHRVPHAPRRDDLDALSRTLDPLMRRSATEAS